MTVPFTNESIDIHIVVITKHISHAPVYVYCHLEAQT